MWVCTHHSTCGGGQRTTFKSWFLPSTMWVLGVRTQVIMFGDKYPYPLNHLACLSLLFEKNRVIALVYRDLC